MSSTTSVPIRIAFALLLTCAALLTYGYALAFFVDALPLPVDKSLAMWTVALQGALSAAAVAMLFCYPFAFLHRTEGHLLASLVPMAAMLTRLPEFTDTSRTSTGLALSLFELCIFAVLLVLATKLAQWDLARRRSVRRPKA